MIDKNKIHKNSEIWQYEGLVEFTEELIEFFEDERKRNKRETMSDHRHLAFEELDSNTIYKSIKNKEISLECKVELLEELNEVRAFLDSLTEKQRKRYCLHKFFGMSFEKIAIMENLNKKTVWESVHQVEEKIKRLNEK